ncbi:MAG: NINE protein [Sandaracinaceae bacterium]
MRDDDDDHEHSLLFGYGFWLLGFLGLHRFYFGRRLTGILWFFTAGLLGIGWVIDLFLMPSLAASAKGRYRGGPFDYNIAWLLWVFLGVFGVHRMYLRRWITGVIWLLTGGLFGLGYLYDLLTLNEQVSLANEEARDPLDW